MQWVLGERLLHVEVFRVKEVHSLVVLHQIHLHLIVFDAHIEIVDVGIFEALLFFPDLFVQLATNVSANVFERGELRYEPAVAEERGEELAEGAVLEGANRPHRFGIAADEVADGVPLF